MAVTAEQVAQLRASVGLPPEPQSDAIWESRPWATLEDIRPALENKAGVIREPENPALFLHPDDPQHPDQKAAALQREGFAQQASVLYPWLTPSLIDVFTSSYVQHGVIDLAVNEVRNGAGKAEYDRIFPGNRRPDGTLRLDENTYLGTVNSYRDSLRDRGLNPDLFEGRFGELIEGETSASEFESRAAAVEQDIILQGDLFIQAFSDLWQLPATVESVFAAVMDPNISDAVLNREISVAQIQGEAQRFGFTRSADRVRDLVALGVGREQARNFFSQARPILRSLGSAAARFGSPDPTVDIEELEGAALGADVNQQRRLQQIQNQQGAEFSQNVTTGNQAATLPGLRA